MLVNILIPIPRIGILGVKPVLRQQLVIPPSLLPLGVGIEIDIASLVMISNTVKIVGNCRGMLPHPETSPGYHYSGIMIELLDCLSISRKVHLHMKWGLNCVLHGRAWGGISLTKERDIPDSNDFSRNVSTSRAFISFVRRRSV